MIASDSTIQTYPHAFLGNLEELSFLLGDLPNRERPGVIAHPTINSCTGVDTKDIAVSKHNFFRGNAMNDLFVYRCADRPRKSTIPLECRNTAMLADIGSSSSKVETPGFTNSPTLRSTSAESCPAAFIASISPGDFKITDMTYAPNPIASTAAICNLQTSQWYQTYLLAITL